MQEKESCMVGNQKKNTTSLARKTKAGSPIPPVLSSFITDNGHCLSRLLLIIIIRPYKRF